jgi:hypothetical protein
MIELFDSLLGTFVWWRRRRGGEWDYITITTDRMMLDIWQRREGLPPAKARLRCRS